MRTILLQLIFILLLSVNIYAQDISGVTTAIVNLRSGPNTSYDIITTLSGQTPIILLGRDETRRWLLISSNGYRGWINYTYANVDGDIASLPVSTEVSTLTQPSDSDNDEVQNDLPPQQLESTPPGIILGVTPTSRRIFVQGQLMGNRANVFSKAGDSITANPLFLNAIGFGQIDYGQYEYLRSTVEYFSQARARTHNSFANYSLAAFASWTTSDVLYSGNAPANLCKTDETPLACELRITRPSIVLIMFGTNDANSLDHVSFEENLREIVEVCIDAGVIPVVSTIPDHLYLASLEHTSGRVERYNNIIRIVANHYDTPLWDYWQIMQWLPNKGISEDFIHPSAMSNLIEDSAIFTDDALQYGFNLRNLTALMVLDTIKKEIIGAE